MQTDDLIVLAEFCKIRPTCGISSFDKIDGELVGKTEWLNTFRPRS
jgi:hypothetical protein